MTHRCLSFVLLLLLASPTVAGAQTPAPADKPWWERITFSGDFRGRYEGFFQDERETRNRERFRLRVGLRTEITEDVDFGLRLASGDADDIASSNQTMGELLARKPITVEQAFLTYTPSGFSALTLGVGKYGSPARRTQMVWDDDVNWEGTYEQLGRTVAGTTLRFIGVQSPLNEVSADDDAFLIGWYGEAGRRVGRHNVGLSIANYNFLRADQIAVAVDRRGLANANTNLLTRDAAGRVTGFVSGFNLIDVIATATLATGATEYPVNLTADFVHNTDAATDQDSGVWIAAGIGRAARPKTVAFTYTFGRIEQDATVRTFNFSDIPGTNVRMNMLNLSFMPVARVNLDVIAILTKPLIAPPGPATNLLKRIQIDSRIAF